MQLKHVPCLNLKVAWTSETDVSNCSSFLQQLQRYEQNKSLLPLTMVARVFKIKVTNRLANRKETQKTTSLELVSPLLTNDNFIHFFS